MKRILLFSLISFLSASLSHAKGLYFVEPMICVGKLQEPIPKQIHKDYYQVVLKFVSFWSTKKNGKKAPSLEINIDWFHADEEVDPNTTRFGTTWYSNPLRRLNNNRIYATGWTWKDNFEDFEIIASKNDTDGAREDLLTGTFLASFGTTYDLNCTAIPVNSPSRVDDNR